LLAAVLARKYIVPQTGNAKAGESESLTPRILALHKEGKGPSEIGRLLGIDRKRVARVLADAK
jgi:hypothetical protein